MEFQAPLVRATLIRRYKRFLADVRLDDGREVTAHCANPGAMLGLQDGGARIWLEPNDDPKRKLRFSWKLVELGSNEFAGIDTSLPNRIVGEALRDQSIDGLADYSGVRPEVRYGKNSRIDFLLTERGQPDLYLEVKNAHLSRNPGLVEFPDCVTARGAKHLDELSTMVGEGHRAMMLYLVQRTDCSVFALADDLDPTYAAAFDRAMAAGVEAICFDTKISASGVSFGKQISMAVR